jgi:hypothetical protein
MMAAMPGSNGPRLKAFRDARRPGKVKRFSNLPANVEVDKRAKNYFGTTRPKTIVGLDDHGVNTIYPGFAITKYLLLGALDVDFEQVYAL